MVPVPREKETVMVLSAAERQRHYRERQTAWGLPGDKITPDPSKHLAKNHGCYHNWGAGRSNAPAYPAPDGDPDRIELLKTGLVTRKTMRYRPAHVDSRR